MFAKTLCGATLCLVVLGAGIRAVAAAEDTEGWESEIAVGLNLTDGNSETMQVNSDFGSTFKRGANEAILSASHAYGETKQAGALDDKTVDNGKVSGQYNRIFTESLYAYLRTEYEWDDIADVDYRVKVSPGTGLYLIQNDTTFLAVELWPAWVAEKVGGITDDAFVLRFAERAEHKLGETAKIWNSVEFLPEFEDFGVYLLTAEAGAEAAMNASLSLRIVAKDDYDSHPAPGREKNDLTLTAGLVYKL